MDEYKVGDKIVLRDSNPSELFVVTDVLENELQCTNEINIQKVQLKDATLIERDSVSVQDIKQGSYVNGVKLTDTQTTRSQGSGELYDYAGRKWVIDGNMNIYPVEPTASNTYCCEGGNRHILAIEI